MCRTADTSSSYSAGEFALNLIARNMCILFTLIVLSASMAGCAGSRANWVARNDPAAFTRMIADLQQARVIFVGEFHDQQAHHRLQLDIMTSLHKRGVPLAIGLEMFDLESQQVLDQWVKGAMGLQEFGERYRASWTIDWTEYDTILLFARNNGIPLIGLNAPEEVVRKVARGGVQSLAPADRARIPHGVNVTQSDSYRSFLRDAFADHPLPETAFTTFSEAQALRNNTMARLIQDYLIGNPGKTMVVVTGVGHAKRRAVAEPLAQATGISSKVIIPVTEGIVERLERSDADYFVYP